MRRTTLAAAVQIAIMVVVLVPPVALKYTGTIVYLETEKMDPRALVRGDYVILGYRLAQGILPAHDAGAARRHGWPVYVTVTTTRPARFVTAGFERPRLEAGQACLVGRARGFGTRSVDFPQIAQYFVPEGTGGAIERRRGADLLAKVATSRACNAVLIALEPR